MTEIPELTAAHFDRSIRASLRRRLVEGDFRTGEDIAAVRRFVGLSQPQFAAAVGISVGTLRNWEQGHRHPSGPALALLRSAAKHPSTIYSASVNPR